MTIAARGPFERQAMMTQKRVIFVCMDFRLAYLSSALRRGFLWRRWKVVFYCFRPSPGALNALVARLSRGMVEILPVPARLAVINRSPEGSVRKKVYGEILSEISDKLDREFLDSPTSLLGALEGPLGRLKKELALYFEQDILSEVADDLVLIEIARWLIQNPQSPLRGGEMSVLIDRRSYWDELAREYGERTGVSCSSVARLQIKGWGVRLIYSLSQLLAECAFSLVSPGRRGTSPAVKVGIPQYSYSNFTDFLERRNYYLFWYPESGINPGNILIYSDGALDVPLAEGERIKAMGFSLLAANSVLRTPLASEPRHRCSPASVASLLAAHFRQLALLLLRVRSRFQWEQWKLLASLFSKLPYWEDFFLRNRIKIKFRFHTRFSHRDIAAQLAGAVTLSYHYSNHSPETFSPLHRDFCDSYFVWGRDSEAFFSDERSATRNVIHSGYVFDHAFRRVEGKAAALRQRLSQRGLGFVISVMDENITGIYREGMLELYSALLKLLLEHPDIGLLIKPKSDSTRAALASDPRTAEAFAALEKAGRVEMLSGSVFPVEAGKASDLVIGVYADSTAVLECALAGVPSVAYECCFGTQRERGAQPFVYHEMGAFLQALLDHKSGKAEMGGAKCWRETLDKKDAFRDGRAAARVGSYIKSLLRAFDSGDDKDAALSIANAAYTESFGSQAVVTTGRPGRPRPQIPERII